MTTEPMGNIPARSQPALLTVKDTLDLVEVRVTRANGHWTFLLTANLAFLAALAAYTQPIPLSQRVLLTFGLLLLYAFNLAAVLRAQQEMNAFNRSVHDLLAKAETQSSLSTYLKERNFEWYPKLTWVVHALADTVVLYFLWRHA